MRLAVAGAPDRAEAHEKLGLAFFLAGDAPGAVPHLERARDLDRGSASAHLNLAAVYAALGRVAEARQLATRRPPRSRRTQGQGAAGRVAQVGSAIVQAGTWIPRRGNG